jgi:HK97 family phage major capsid protein
MTLIRAKYGAPSGPRTWREIAADRDALREDIKPLAVEAEALSDKIALQAGEPKDGDVERLERLQQGIAKRTAEMKALDEEYREALKTGARDGSLTSVRPFVHPRAQPTAEDRRITPQVAAAHDAGLRTIDAHKSILDARAGDRLVAMIEEEDPLGLAGRYLAAVGNPAYASAFFKMLRDPMTGHLGFNPKEVDAVRAVSLVQDEQRATAMGVGSGGIGGYAVPFYVDPSIVNSGNGVLNPLRQISRIVVSPVGTWHGVSADQVVASYQQEGTEMADASPTLVQPTITAQRGSAFVPISFELEGDWRTAANGLSALLSDARDVLDATKMLTGLAASYEPTGILSIGQTGALTTSQRVYTNGSTAFAVGDSWLLKAQLAARFINDVSVLGAPITFDTVYRFTGGNATEPPILPTREGAFFGRPKYEMSTMDTGTSAGKKILLAGDFSNFAIVDRLGFTVELVPHLFGAANHYPTGQRGVIAWWRTGTGVLAANAFRYLEVKA